MKSTREKILDTAERLFAEKGFEGVSVREITNRAGCNVASISYYFGNKKGLYLTVFRERLTERARKVQSSFWKELEGHNNPSSEEVIRALARAFLKSPFSEKERLLHHKLIAREVSRPTEAFEIFHTEVVAPFFDALFRLLKRHIKGTTTKEEQLLYVLSIFAQVMHFNLSRNMLTAITGKKLDEPFIDRLIEHIVRFSLYGIKGGKGR